MTTNTKSFLDAVNTVDNTVDIYIPSDNTDYIFTPMVVAHHRMLLKTSIDDAQSNSLSFLVALNDVITQCSQGANLKLIDKTPTIIQLRTNSVGNNITIDGEQFQLPTSADIKKAAAEYTCDLTTPIQHNTFTVTLREPTLQIDTLYYKKLLQSQKSGDKLSAMITDLYMYELCKFIDTIHIDGVDQQLDFSALTIPDQVLILNQLPLALNNTVHDKIAEYKQLEKQLLTVNGKEITIDMNFFKTKEVD